jgi:steroid delta-isomerase-like uncharacterized protein
MTRLTLLVPFVVVMSLFAAVPALQSSAQDASPAAGSPSTMSLEETHAVIDAYLAALVAREDIAPFFKDDVVLELVDVGQRIQGRDAVAEVIEGWQRQSFDARPELTNLIVGEGTAAIEAVFVGTQTGEFSGIPASGKHVAVPYAVFYDVADGRITAVRIYGFVSGMVAQLTAGATPAAGTPAP